MFVMTKGTVVTRSFRFFLPTNFGLALGIAAATAVIVGALVVGDSMRGSLKGLVQQRLANIVLLLHSRHYFDPVCLQRLDVQDLDPQLSWAPIILLSNCSAEHQTEGTWGRASKVQLIAVDEQFISALDPASRTEVASPPGMDEILINESLARELNVAVGDDVTLRLGQTSGIPAENPLGRRDEGPTSLPRQRVVGIVKDQTIGGLGFHSSQEAPMNVFASLAGVQDLLNMHGRVNAALIFSGSPSQGVDPREKALVQTLDSQLRPALEDYGLQLHRHTRNFPDAARGEQSESQTVSIFDYFQLSSKDLLIDEPVAQSIAEALGNMSHYRSMTYLANTISKVRPLPREQQFRPDEPRITSLSANAFGEADSFDRTALAPLGRTVPYSILFAMSPNAPDLELVKFRNLTDREIRTPYCWVNSWLAEELQISSGDWIQMMFYNPETVDGELRESLVRLIVAGVVPITRPEQPFRRNRLAQFSQLPTRFNDPDLTPTVPGITNQESISNWDVPFELVHRDLILPQDDQYWEDHRLTPKIILPYSFARSLFHSRFGTTTAIHIPVDSEIEEDEVRERIEDGLMNVRTDFGLTFQPVRFQQFTAAVGTTPFDLLFLSLSAFVIVAALVLVALLFKLGFQQRTSQIGLFFAQGFTIRQVLRMLILEMSLVAGVGAFIGIPLGLAYAKLMIVGLETWWIGAIQSQFLRFSFSIQSLVTGAVAGLAASVLTIMVSMRSTAKLQPLMLLRGGESNCQAAGQREYHQSLAGAAICLILALFLGFMAVGQMGMIRAGCFFGSGMLLLLGIMSAVRSWLAYPHLIVQPEKQGLLALAVRATVRNPTRSTMSIGLLAIASFLVASMSVFRAAPAEHGYGNFDLIGVSTQPILDNLGSPAARNQAIGSAADEILGSTVVPLRMSEGEDASCTNLYQVAQPTILGVSEKLQSLSDSTSSFEFRWAATADAESPWSAIRPTATGDRGMPIPVILDQNTAMWSLKQGSRLGSLIHLKIGEQEIYFKVVGLLSNSVLQGKLIISETNFLRLYPKISGHRFFLIRSGDKTAPNKVAEVLERGWSDFGMDVTASSEILQRFLNVQNTYISAFQALGALGLLLGTIGLVAVQLRSILERRHELALMQAVGFSKFRLVRLLSLESGLLLGSGLLIGLACSAIALVPYVIEVGPQLNALHPLVLVLAIMGCGLVAAGITGLKVLRLPVLANLRSD